jgi:5-hydroxyisourate hydrolase
MSGITTHVLDTSRGRPASGVRLALHFHEHGAWKELAHGATDEDGRCKTLTPAVAIAPGRYKIVFETGAYFAAQKVETFYPEVSVIFEVKDGAAHYHVPLLLSPWGYSTYRGS